MNKAVREHLTCWNSDFTQAVSELSAEINNSNMNVINMNGLESQAAKLLNFKEKIDVGLLDTVITSLYSGEGPQVKYCFISEDL